MRLLRSLAAARVLRFKVENVRIIGCGHEATSTEIKTLEALKCGQVNRDTNKQVHKQEQGGTPPPQKKSHIKTTLEVDTRET